MADCRAQWQDRDTARHLSIFPIAESRMSMIRIPWRVKNFLSNQFPLAYHLMINAGAGGNDPDHWDRRLAETWDAPDRTWVTLNEMVALATSPTDDILDVGSGNGSLLRHLQRLGYHSLHGLDISEYAISRLRSEGLNMHFGRLPGVPLPSSSFDVVIASFVLEHLIRRRFFLRELLRVVKPKGQVIIAVPDNCLGPIDEPEHVIKYTQASLAKLLQRYFVINSIESVRDRNNPIPILFARLQKP